MDLEDCVINEKTVIVAKPFLTNEPEMSWVEMKEKKQIPSNLFKFYTIAKYFSIDKQPIFLQDDKKMAYAHLKTSVFLIKDSFYEYFVLLERMKESNTKSYNPIKKIKGIEYDDNATEEFRRTFQLLIINLYAILDSVAEIIALFFMWGTCGEAQFSSLVSDVKKDRMNSLDKVNYIDIYKQKLVDIIKKEIIVIDGKSSQWFELLKTYRNKLSHFRFYNIFDFCDKENKFYSFLPKVFPYYMEQHLTTTDQGDRQNFKDMIFSLLIHQDVFDFCDGLLNRIGLITDEFFKVFIKYYVVKEETKCPYSDKVVFNIKTFDFKSF